METHIWRIWADGAGESHIEQLSRALRPVDFAPPAPPMEVSDLVPASGAHFLRAPVGWDGDFHQAPRRQYIVVLQGRIEARATDGTGFEIGPGDVVLLEDTWGVGHASRVVGDEDWLALVVVLD
jgi:hypothetical protein